MDGSKSGCHVLQLVGMCILCGVAFGHQPWFDAISEQPPTDVRQTVDQYLQYAQDGSMRVKELLCFTDADDQKLFFAFMPDGSNWVTQSRRLLGSGRAVVFRKAADDCWLVLLDSHWVLDLWRVNGKWQVLCPTPGRACSWKGIEQEKRRWLNTQEMKRVEKETDAQLEGRRNRYLAVLAISEVDDIRNQWVYYSGIPTEDAKTLRGMTLPEFRKAVMLKLDAPDGLRYRVELQDKPPKEGQPVQATFSLENVTDKPIRLMYRPFVHVIDWSNMTTSSGAVVFAKDSNPRGNSEYPFAKQELLIPPGQTRSVNVALTDYYDLHAAKYSISAHLGGIRDANDGYWSGVARTDSVAFQVQARP